jgi:hypothetical protein
LVIVTAEGEAANGILWEGPGRLLDIAQCMYKPNNMHPAQISAVSMLRPSTNHYIEEHSISDACIKVLTFN